jgi:hypothetical protein
MHQAQTGGGERMNSSSTQPDELDEARALIIRLWDDSLTAAAHSRLESLMLHRADVRLLYLEMMRLHAALHQRAGSLAIGPTLESAEADNDTGMSDAMILPALRSYDAEPEYAAEEPLVHEPAIQKRAAEPGANQPVAAARSQPIPAGPARSSLLWGRRGIALMALAASIVLALSVVLVQITTRKPAATVVASTDAHLDTDLNISQGAAIAAGKTLNLVTGNLELKLRGGADVVIEGPATFDVTSPVAMSLTRGRISAIAAGAAHGFVVQTPNARVTDLGTEFGVGVTPAGVTEVDVFQGQVQVAQLHAAAETSPLAIPATLSAGQAAFVVNGAIRPSSTGAMPQAFVRSLSAPRSIDVVDLISGGDGTTGLRNGAIDQRTGESGLLRPAFGIDISFPDYHPVSKLPVVDGCFVPNGNIKIDSDGHTFNFGATSGTSFYQIRAGGTFPWPRPARLHETFTPILGGVDYSQPGHGFFLLHPNAGITFDLNAVRRLHPGFKLDKFQSIVGNTHPSEFANEPARVMVLVDGNRRYYHRQLWPREGPVKVDVPLTDSDHFLTIVTADNGISPRYNWIIFGDPHLQ